MLRIIMNGQASQHHPVIFTRPDSPSKIRSKTDSAISIERADLPTKDSFIICISFGNKPFECFVGSS